VSAAIRIEQGLHTFDDEMDREPSTEFEPNRGKNEERALDSERR